MFTGSTKLPPTKSPQPERLDEVYAALRRGLQSYLQVHQLELDSLGQQIRENKRNGRLGSLYELDKQVKAIERFMRRLEFHLSKVEELYDAYCIQRRLRDGASKMVAAFNSATGSREARESLSEANKGYRECTEHMCSLESELESQMGEFHIKMKGLAGFARLCAGDQYEVLMRYGRQRWRLRGRVEVSNKQIWDSEEYIFLPLVTELLSIKVTELKSLANHVVVGSVSCEMLDLFCPLPQTLAVDINDLGTVKLNLEVTWSPFDKDDQTSSTSTVSKRLLSNQSPPDTPSMREQVFYSLLKRQGELENGTVWSNSSESSDDSSSPALASHSSSPAPAPAPAPHAHKLSSSHLLQTTLNSPLSFTPHKSSASTPSLSSNQEEDETEAAEVFSQTETVPNGHVQTSCSHSLVGESSTDSNVSDRASLQSADLTLSCSCTDVSAAPPASAEVTADDSSSVSAEDVKDAEAEKEDSGGHPGEEASDKHSQTSESTQELKQSEVPFPTSTSFIQEVETALESFDFLNCSDLDEEEEEEEEKEKDEQQEKDKGEKEEEDEPHKEKEERFYCGGSDDDDDDDDDDEEANGLEILMEAPEGFRNSDEDRFSESQESSVEDVQDLGQIDVPEDKEEPGEDASHDQKGRDHLATAVF
ncbi:rho family-interacting cell polarization regulator 1-like isoform X2 [Solea solea]|uniref:rho family-interacting cell polarization regulator 1-like isoform X2 n=1 Tax=Solea solea TaxID=90069 RepID=UPI002729C322|nr:rho family-interacting cell polarization regulator 1-like isoform X2 [Solea solea]